MNDTPSEIRVWTEQFKAHSFDVDFKHQATLQTLCRYCQEVAWNHAEFLGVGYSHLKDKGRLWVLARFLMVIERSPKWNEVVTVHTWPRAAKSIFAMRDFEIVDSENRRLGAASSAWLVLDAASRRPLRSDKWLSAFQTLPTRRALPEDPEKLPPSPTATAPASVSVTYSDIDVNAHVNNARYIGWLLDTYPFDFHAAHNARLLEVNFLGETRAGENLKIAATVTSPGEYRHEIVKADGDAVCRARIGWAPRENPPT